MPSRFPFLDQPAPLPFAHRGGALDGLENTMAAFQRAIELGYRYLETDVRATADGVLLAFHDSTLDRVTDGTGRISELPYAEVSRARIGARETIPLVEDLLGEWPHVRLNIDLKEPGAITPLVRALARTRGIGRVCVASFSERRLRRARAACGPDLCTSVSPREALLLRLASYGRVPRQVAPRDIPCAQVPPFVRGLPLITFPFVRTAHELGMQVHAWTVNDPAEMRRLLDLRVDGIITDRIDTLRDLLISRGQWKS